MGINFRRVIKRYGEPIVKNTDIDVLLQELRRMDIASKYALGLFEDEDVSCVNFYLTVFKKEYAKIEHPCDVLQRLYEDIKDVKSEDLEDDIVEFEWS